MKGMELEFKKDKWKIKFEQSNLEQPAYNMKPPHCRTQKCQKLNQLFSSWMAPSLAALYKYHQDRMVAYRRSASSKDVTFLYS
jgi:hypothetical protein